MKAGAAGVLIVALLAAGCSDEVELTAVSTSSDPFDSLPVPGGDAFGIEVLDDADFQPQAASRAVDPYGSLYNPDNVRTVRGAVLGVRRATTRDERVFVILEVGVYGEVVDVILAPEDFLRERGVDIGITDQIEVTGARTLRNTRDTVIARSVRDRHGSYELRNGSGGPLWR